MLLYLNTESNISDSKLKSNIYKYLINYFYSFDMETNTSPSFPLDIEIIIKNELLSLTKNNSQNEISLSTLLDQTSLHNKYKFVNKVITTIDFDIITNEYKSISFSDIFSDKQKKELTKLFSHYNYINSILKTLFINELKP